MAQLPSEKFNIAWFKLAEFVGRKEKERAFALFRLLVHSLPDAAFAAQLEGDLLLAFNDDRAIAVYKRSADLYEESGRFLEAAALYERMVIPKSPELFSKMLFLYKELAHEAKMAHCATNLIRVLVEGGQEEKAFALVENIAISDVYKKKLRGVLPTAANPLCNIQHRL